MKSQLCEMFGIEVPIFAFSHCRDVVVEVSKAGGMGVLGMARMNPERVEEELNWIDEHIGGKPYGIDVLMPSRFDDSADKKFDPEQLLPRAGRIRAPHVRRGRQLAAQRRGRGGRSEVER